VSKSIIVIGGGMAGTAAAHTLVKRGYKVTIMEQNDRLGGRMYSRMADSAVIEMGAGFISKCYTNVLAFMAEVGLGDCLYRQHGSSGIVRGGRVKMATFGTLLDSSVLSWGAKFRALSLVASILSHWHRIDMHEPWRLDVYDTGSIADMFHGIAGKELLEYVLQPMFNGYFYWSPEQTSRAMLYFAGKGLLTGGTCKVRGGLQQIPEKAAVGSTVLLEHAVKEVQRRDDGSYDIVAMHQNKEKVLRADGIVCATTASAVPKIFHDLSDRQRAFFESVQYSATAVVGRAYPQNQTRGNKGIAFPRSEGGKLAAVTVWPEPTTNGTATSSLKIYVSGTVGAAVCKEPEVQIAQTLDRGLESVRAAVLEPGARPAAEFVQRWPEALPLFAPGHFKRLRAFAAGEIENPAQNLVFAGDYIGGPFIEGAFTSGVDAANRLADSMERGRHDQ
jgi:oxygen-dependent protoporphyrinogen oxidase